MNYYFLLQYLFYVASRNSSRRLDDTAKARNMLRTLFSFSVPSLFSLYTVSSDLRREVPVWLMVWLWTNVTVCKCFKM